MSTHVELYEALKDTIGVEAARMVADAVTDARDLATKTDLAEVKLAIAELRGEVRELVKDTQVSQMRWMIAMFIPLYMGTFGTLVTLLLRG